MEPALPRASSRSDGVVQNPPCPLQRRVQFSDRWTESTFQVSSLSWMSDTRMLSCHAKTATLHPLYTSHFELLQRWIVNEFGRVAVARGKWQMYGYWHVWLSASSTLLVFTTQTEHRQANHVKTNNSRGTTARDGETTPKQTFQLKKEKNSGKIRMVQRDFLSKRRQKKA